AVVDDGAGAGACKPELSRVRLPCPTLGRGAGAGSGISPDAGRAPPDARSSGRAALDVSRGVGAGAGAGIGAAFEAGAGGPAVSLAGPRPAFGLASGLRPATVGATSSGFVPAPCPGASGEAGAGAAGMFEGTCASGRGRPVCVTATAPRITTDRPVA